MTKREQRAIRFPWFSPIMLPDTFCLLTVRILHKLIRYVSFFIIGFELAEVFLVSKNNRIAFPVYPFLTLQVVSIYFYILDMKFVDDCKEELNQFKSKHEGFLNESEEQ